MIAADIFIASPLQTNADWRLAGPTLAAEFKTPVDRSIKRLSGANLRKDLAVSKQSDAVGDCVFRSLALRRYGELQSARNASVSFQGAMGSAPEQLEELHLREGNRVGGSAADSGQAAEPPKASICKTLINPWEPEPARQERDYQVPPQALVGPQALVVRRGLVVRRDPEDDLRDPPDRHLHQRDRRDRPDPRPLEERRQAADRGDFRLARQESRAADPEAGNAFSGISAREERWYSSGSRE